VRVQAKKLNPEALRYGNLGKAGQADNLVGHANEALDEFIQETLGREVILAEGRLGLPRCREQLFAVMQRNALPATAFFDLPAERTFEVGAVNQNVKTACVGLIMRIKHRSSGDKALFEEE